MPRSGFCVESVTSEVTASKLNAHVSGRDGAAGAGAIGAAFTFVGDLMMGRDDGWDNAGAGGAGGLCTAVLSLLPKNFFI